MQGAVLTIKLPWVRLIATPSAILAAAIIFVSVTEPDKAVVLVPLFFVFPALLALRFKGQQVVVTEQLVIFRRGPVLGNQEVGREAVQAIRIFPNRVALAGDVGKHLMAIPFLNQTQADQLASVLGVPLYDHRIWLRLGAASEGRPISQGAEPANPSQ